jgi:hypothetical protein
MTIVPIASGAKSFRKRSDFLTALKKKAAREISLSPPFYFLSDLVIAENAVRVLDLFGFSG